MPHMHKSKDSIAAQLRMQPSSTAREVPIEGPDSGGGFAPLHRLTGPVIHELEDTHHAPWGHSQPDSVEEPEEGGGGILGGGRMVVDVASGR